MDLKRDQETKGLAMANYKVVPPSHPMCKAIQLDTKDLRKWNTMNMEKTDSPKYSLSLGLDWCAMGSYNNIVILNNKHFPLLCSRSFWITIHNFPLLCSRNFWITIHNCWRCHGCLCESQVCSKMCAIVDLLLCTAIKLVEEKRDFPEDWVS